MTLRQYHIILTDCLTQ